MSLNSNLECILAERCYTTSQADGTITLQGGDSGSSMEVVITGILDPVIAVSMNRLRHLSALKPGPWCQICDYLLIFGLSGQIYAVLVELKKTLQKVRQSRRREPREQLRRSLPLLKYLHSVYEIEFGPGQNETELSIGYFLVGERAQQHLDKQPVRAKPSQRRISEEPYEDIIVRTFIGSRIEIGDLVSTV